MNLNESDLRTLLETSHQPVVALFSAKWCGPCRMFGPIFEKVAGNYSAGNVEFAKMDIDECVQLCEDLNVSVVPAIFVFKDSKVVTRKDGGFPTEAALEQFVKNAVQAGARF